MHTSQVAQYLLHNPIEAN